MKQSRLNNGSFTPAERLLLIAAGAMSLIGLLCCFASVAKAAELPRPCLLQAAKAHHKALPVQTCTVVQPSEIMCLKETPEPDTLTPIYVYPYYSMLEVPTDDTFSAAPLPVFSQFPEFAGEAVIGTGRVYSSPPSPHTPRIAAPEIEVGNSGICAFTVLCLSLVIIRSKKS